MHLSKSQGNNFKTGRSWLYFKDYNKHITFEWNLAFEPLTLYVAFDGGEGDWTFSFWFIWTFYITFNNIFKWYPKEWNSCANDGKGGYLNSAERRIGINQYKLSALWIYLWHDGENSWYKDKDTKIWYKYINLEGIWKGYWRYNTIEDYDKEEYIDLPEGKQKIKIEYRFWHLKHNRFYMKLWNKKGKSISINSEIKYPSRKQTQEDLDIDELERTMSRESFNIKEDQDISEAIKQYKEKVIQLRKVESENWVPYEYRKNYSREEKLKRILNETQI